MHKHNTVAVWSWDPGQDTGYILRALCPAAHTHPESTKPELSPLIAGCSLLCLLKLGQKGETGEKLQRTTLISLIELGTRDCCNYDYL